LENDRRNRNEIANFIKDIPNDLNLLIEDKLGVYEEYLNGKRSFYEGNAVFCLSDSLKFNSDYMYSFIIDMVEDSITIKKSKINKDGLENENELVLCAETTYNSISTLGKQRLGTFKCNGNIVDYNFINTVFGLMFVISKDGILNKFKRVRNTDDFKNNSVYSNESFIKVRKK